MADRAPRCLLANDALIVQVNKQGRPFSPMNNKEFGSDRGWGFDLSFLHFSYNLGIAFGCLLTLDTSWEAATKMSVKLLNC